MGLQGGWSGSGSFTAETRRSTSALVEDGPPAHVKRALPTIENTRLLCLVHTQYEAWLELGDAFTDGFAHKRSPDARVSQKQPSLALGP
jgi:hypothetical protein